MFFSLGLGDNMNKREHGQAIVIIAIALAAVIAFMALAIDGGRILAERRRLQNVADFAAMAAASVAAEGGDSATAIQAALDQAGINDAVDSDAGTNNSNVVDVIVNYPPVGGEHVGDGQYYEVLVRTVHEPFLTGLLNVDTSTVAARAVSHFEVSQTIAGPSAVQSLTTSGYGITIGSGSTKTTLNISGGDLFSNSNVQKNDRSEIKVKKGKLKSHGVWSNTNNLSPAAEQNLSFNSISVVAAPACPTNHFSSNSYINPTTTTLNPGYYDHEIWLGVNGRNYKLNPGVYCLKNGLVVTNGANLSGTGILLVMLNGELRFGGSGTINLERASSIQDIAGNEFGGILMYGTPADSVLPNGYSFGPAIPAGRLAGLAASGSACGSAPALFAPFLGPNLGGLFKKNLGCPTQSKQVTLSGSSTTTFNGTIYNPGHTCVVTGAPSVIINGIVVCEDITISGTTVTINSVAEQNYRLPPIVELTE